MAEQNKSSFGLEVQSQEDTNVRTYSQGQRPEGRGVADGIESRSYARPTLEMFSTEVGLGTISSDQAQVAPLLEGGGIRNPPMYCLIGPIILQKDLK